MWLPEEGMGENGNCLMDIVSIMQNENVLEFCFTTM